MGSRTRVGCARPLPLVVAVVTMAACSLGGGEQGGSPAEPDREPPGDEPVDLHVVPVPDSVAGARFPWYSASGEKIVYSGTPEGSDRVEVLTIGEDGSENTCLTCGVAPTVAEPLLKPIAFRDGRRLLLRVGEQTLVQAADHAVLECRPSVDDCRHAELVPVTIPPPGGAAVVTQDQRELRVAPDGEHVGFTQVRTSASGDGIMTAVVAKLRRTASTYELRDARVVSTRGELKGFTPDGQGVLIAAFAGPYEAANPDVLRVDLATGDETRVTSWPDYDEPLELSPDGRWYVVGSGRTSGLFETVAQVRRPNFIGDGLAPLTAALFVGHRDEVIEPWLVRTGAEDRGATGQLLDPDAPDEGFDGRAIPNWSPDGTGIVFWEGRDDPNETGQSRTRIVVADLADRAPLPRRSSPPSPDPAWARPLDGFVPDDPPPPTSRSGRHSGSVTITRHPAAGHPDRTIVEVTYDGFSDDGEWIIDGEERADHQAGVTGQSVYTADLTVSGAHDGHLTADATISPAGITGSIVSEVDGHHLELP